MHLRASREPILMSPCSLTPPPPSPVLSHVDKELGKRKLVKGKGVEEGNEENDTHTHTKDIDSVRAYKLDKPWLPTAFTWPQRFCHWPTKTRNSILQTSNLAVRSKTTPRKGNRSCELSRPYRYLLPSCRSVLCSTPGSCLITNGHQSALRCLYQRH